MTEPESTPRTKPECAPERERRVQPQYILAETRLEYRDGGPWVSGLCPACWERVAVRAPPRGTTVEARCTNGHRLWVYDQTSEGRIAADGCADSGQ